MNAEKYGSELELNLLENGIDFILKGIDELFNEEHVLRGYSNPSDIPLGGYKYGVIHLYSGFLLLLKERLLRHDLVLIFNGKIEAVKEKLNKGQMPNTVNLDEALKRLESHAGVNFSEDDLCIIKAMQKTRNEFEHYRVKKNQYFLWKTILDFLNLIDFFMRKYLSINIEKVSSSSRLVNKIHTIDSIWRRESESRVQELYDLAEEQFFDEYDSAYDFLSKTINICRILAVKEEASSLGHEIRERLLSDRWMQKLTEALSYISAYDCMNGGFDDVDLNDIIFIETSVIESIAEIWKYEPIGYEWLMKYLKNELELQDFSIAAIVAVEKYWSDHPHFVDDLADVAMNNPFSSMRDSYEDSYDSISYLDSPRQAAMKVLVKHYPEHPKVLSLLKERSQNDSDGNVREWAYEQLQIKSG